MFNHLDIEIPRLQRVTIDGVRYYDTPDNKMVSITSVISHYNKDKFAKWRKKVGEEKANAITRKPLVGAPTCIRSRRIIFSIYLSLE